MGFTIFGREENQNVRSTELEIIGYVLEENHGYIMNFAHHLSGHLLATATSRYKTRITHGGLITHIAIVVANFVERDHTAVLGGNLLELAYFGSIYWLHSEHQMLRPGHISWMFQRNALFTLPDTTCRASFERGQDHYLYADEQIPPPY